MGRLEGEDAETLDYRITDNLGYGYIGINASFVPDIDIRKAIMTTFNTAPVLDYYGGGTLASIPVSYTHLSAAMPSTAVRLKRLWSPRA